MNRMIDQVYSLPQMVRESFQSFDDGMDAGSSQIVYDDVAVGVAADRHYILIEDQVLEFFARNGQDHPERHRFTQPLLERFQFRP